MGSNAPCFQCFFIYLHICTVVVKRLCTDGYRCADDVQIGVDDYHVEYMGMTLACLFVP